MRGYDGGQKRVEGKNMYRSAHNVGQRQKDDDGILFKRKYGTGGIMVVTSFSDPKFMNTNFKSKGMM